MGLTTLISVECIVQGNLCDMKCLLIEIKNFAEAVTCQDQSELSKVSLKKDTRTSYVSYDHVVWALENLSFNYFIPWKDAKSLVHGHCFVQSNKLKKTSFSKIRSHSLRPRRAHMQLGISLPSPRWEARPLLGYRHQFLPGPIYTGGAVV